MRVGDVCAVDRTGQVHATRSPRSKTRRKTWDTVCGKRAQLLGVRTSDGAAITLSWPLHRDDAQVFELTDQCAACRKAAPGKPERMRLTPRDGKP